MSQEPYLMLEPEQVSLAFLCLVENLNPPQDLKHLQLRDWLALSQMLEDLLQERELLEKLGRLQQFALSCLVNPPQTQQTALHKVTLKALCKNLLQVNNTAHLITQLPSVCYRLRPYLKQKLYLLAVLMVQPSMTLTRTLCRLLKGKSTHILFCMKPCMASYMQ